MQKGGEGEKGEEWEKGEGRRGRGRRGRGRHNLRLLLQLQEHLRSSLLGPRTEPPAQDSSKEPAAEGRPDTTLAR